jgi:broad specificity phosphatase PhoE
MFYMSEIYLVRHAQASFGEGNYDRLSVLGHQQAKWLGEYFEFRNFKFDRIICGDMVRHRETLDGICAAMGTDPESHQADAHWNEFDFEALVAAYLTDHPEDRPGDSALASEFTRLLIKTMLAWASGSLEQEIPETWVQFEQRVRDGLLVATSQPDRASKTLVVSSGGAIAMAIRQVLAAPSEAMIQMNIQVRNSAYSQLFFNQDNIHLAGFNHVPHLEHPDRGDAVTYF